MRQRIAWGAAGAVLLIGILLGGCSEWFPLEARIGVRGSSEGPIPFTVAFTSARSLGRVASQTWDFGDPSSGAENASTAASPSHTYTQHGAYLVTLTVVSRDGRSSRDTLVIRATNPPPVAVLEPTPSRGPAPLAVSFDLSRSVDPAGIVPVPAGRIVSYSLDFGDGAPTAVGEDIGARVVHTYTVPEIRTATLTVVDDDGAVGVTSRRIVVEGVVRTLTAPGPDPAGLAHHGSTLWLSDLTLKRIHKLRVSDGAVLASFDAPGSPSIPLDGEKSIVPGPIAVGTPAGLAWQDGALWVACVSDGKLYRVNPDLPPSDPAHVQVVLGNPEFTPYSLAYGGGALWIGDVVRGRIFKVDPATGTILASFAAPSASPADAAERGLILVAPLGLAWADGRLWVTAGATLVRVNPWTGAVEDSLRAPGASPSGLAYDGRMLWVCDPNGANPGRIDRVVVP